jgi:hypothetical protein
VADRFRKGCGGRNVASEGKNVGNLNFAWDDVEVNAIASISGTINGKRVKAQRLAP